jgi:hypothetical protein
VSERNRATVEMHFADGATIDTWHTLTMRDAFNDPLGDLQFETFPPLKFFADYKRRLAKGEIVTVLVNGVLQGGFLIETVERTIDPKRGAGFKLTCKTPLITPYQGHVDPDLALKADKDIEVTALVAQVMLPYGFTQVRGDDRASVNILSGVPIGGGKTIVTTSKLKHRDAKAHENETAYQFCARLLTRLGVVLRCAPDSELLVCAPHYTGDAAYTVVQNRDGGIDGDYFVGAVTIHDSNDDQFSECTVRGVRPDDGDSSNARPIGSVTSASLFPKRPAYTSSVASYKPKILKDTCSRDVERAKSVAKLELGLRGANAYTVSGEVDGWISTTKRVWTVDTLARVYVELEELDEVMYLLDRTLEQDPKGGQRTKLKFIPKGALVIGDVPR